MSENQKLDSESSDLIETPPDSKPVPVSRHPLGKFAPFFDRYAVALPLTLYVCTGFLFFTVFQAVIYRKVCLEEYQNETFCAEGKRIHSDKLLQTRANHILILTTISLTVPTIFSATFLGSVGDKISRKIALLCPFVGLIICDVGYLIQTITIEYSAYWFVVNQLIFGLFGGYSAIFSSIFAKSMASCKDSDEKSKLMGLLEGLMGLGGTVGYVSAGPLLRALNYSGVFLLILILHIVCFLLIILFVWDTSKPRSDGEKYGEINGLRCKDFSQHFYQAFITAFKYRPNNKRASILTLLMAYTVSYLVLFGSQDIMFYYLKHQLNWKPAIYGYLNGSIYALTTLTTLFLFRLLKHRKVTDTVLALMGLFSRLMGRAHLAAVWSTWSVFILVPFDMFGRFGSAALRSLISQQVDTNEQGKIFAMVALLEAVSYLLSSLVFNALFPATLSFLPQLSYIILAVLMVIPVTCLSVLHLRFKKEQKRMKMLPAEG